MNAAAKRLDRHDWLSAGFEALTQSGPDALKAEPLARRLGTTKGSFYWHFKDVPDYHAALLETWEARVIAETDAALAAQENPVGKLRDLAQIIADPSRDIPAEPAIRAWAAGHDGAAQKVARVDAYWLTLAQHLLSETGIRNPEMARIICAAGVGMAGLEQDRPGHNRDAIGSLVDLVLALR